MKREIVKKCGGQKKNTFRNRKVRHTCLDSTNLLHPLVKRNWYDQCKRFQLKKNSELETRYVFRIMFRYK